MTHVLGNMPLGDPKGGNFQYTVEGLPENIVAATIPVTDVDRSTEFYSGVLKMEVVSRSATEAVLRFGSSFLFLRKSAAAGTDTGVYIGVEDPFVFHRRMVDEDVVFTRHPERGPIGVYASFRDPDSNVVHVVESRPRLPPQG
jgi:catechol 2,3-dioxygenase-like lactoylglutathione lyase family enzyme